MMQGMMGMDPMMMQMMMRQQGGQGGMAGQQHQGIGQLGSRDGMHAMYQPEPAPTPVANLGFSPAQPQQQPFNTMQAQPSPIQQQFAAQDQMTQAPQSGFGNWWEKNQGNVAQSLFAASKMF